MATSTIKIQNAGSEYKSGSLKVSRSGTIVTLNGYLYAPIHGATTVANISEKFRPGDVVRALCNVGSNAYSVGDLAYVAVATSGDISITPKDTSATYSTCYMSLSWTV